MGDLFGNAKPPAPKELLSIFDEAFQAANGGIRAPFVIKRDTALAKNLLSRYALEDLTRWSKLFFSHPDSFIRQSGYTFNVFVACIGKVIQYDQRLSRTARETPRPQASPELIAHIREQRKLEYGR